MRIMISRRSLLALFAAVPAVALTGRVALAADHPSMAYMNKVGKDLLSAHRHATNAAFLRTILRHGDVPSIAQYALGDYQSKLPRDKRSRYERGVAAFMSRYFASQSRQYPIAKYEIMGAEADGGSDVLVQTKIYLMSGQVFNVAWKLVWRGGSYRVRDARVLGFWLTSGLRSEVTSFLGKRDGDFGQLLQALGT
jgi:phospholipid transport system substrate-binding protein